MKYSERFKEQMVRRLVGPDAMSALALSREVGVSQPTLSRWLQQAKVESMTQDDEPTPKRAVTRTRSPEEKLRLFQESMALSDEELGAFLRREGLHEDELRRLQKEVRETALAALKPPKKKRRGRSPEQRRIAKLEKELKRKEKALAETAALLVLQGKVQAFLASQEDEEGDGSGGSER